MRKNWVICLCLLAAASTCAAATIQSGTLNTIRGDQAYAGWNLQVSGPGLQLGATRPQTDPPIGVPLCTGTCTYTFSGTIAGSAYSFVWNGVTYQPNQQGYIVVLSMTFTGTQQTAVAVCTNCPLNGPGPQQYETTWTPSPFQMTGVITVTQQTPNGVVPVLSESLSGYGFVTARSSVSQQAGPWNASSTTFTFIPESSTMIHGCLGVALLAIASLRRLRLGITPG